MANPMNEWMNERTNEQTNKQMRNNSEITTVCKMQANINFFTELIQELYKNITHQLQ